MNPPANRLSALRRRARVILFPIILCAPPVGAGRARAETTADDRALATALFKDGRALMAAGRIPEACAKLEESHRLDPSGGTILNLALCHEQQGLLARSWSEFNEAAAFARRDLRRDREAVAVQYADALEPRLSRLTIVVPETSRTEGLRVERDGRELGSASWSTAMPVDGGEHVVRATAPGMEPFTRTASMAREGDAQTVEIPLLRPARAVPAPPAKPAVTAPVSPPPAVLYPIVDRAPRPRNLRRTLAWTIGAAGFVQLGIAGYFGLRAFDLHGQSNDLCPGGSCTSDRGVELNNQAGSAADVATVLSITGFASVATGVYLLVTSRESSTALVAAKPTLLVAISGHGSMIALQDRF